jgi:hypothetical protein
MNRLLQELQGLSPTESPKSFLQCKYLLALKWNTSTNYSKPLYRLKVASVADI